MGGSGVDPYLYILFCSHLFKVFLGLSFCAAQSEKYSQKSLNKTDLRGIFQYAGDSPPVRGWLRTLRPNQTG
jgi:hypothetical protein